MAVDIYPVIDKYPVPYGRARAAYDYYGKCAKAMGLIWGGDWNDPRDYGHIELGADPSE